MKKSTQIFLVACCLVVAMTGHVFSFSLPEDIASHDFLRAGIMNKMNDALKNNNQSVGDKSDPLVKNLVDLGGNVHAQLYVFDHEGNSVVVIDGKSPITLGSTVCNEIDGGLGIFSNADAVKIYDYLYVYNSGEESLKLNPTDFPDSIMTKLNNLAYENSVKLPLHAKGHSAIFKPSGDGIEKLKEFLALDEMDEKHSLTIRKWGNKNAVIFRVAGSATNPLNTRMTLKYPVFTYYAYKKIFGAKGEALIDGKNYNFIFEGPTPTAPSIISLKRDGDVTPQDLISVSKALSQPLYGQSGLSLGWDFSMIPSFHLSPMNHPDDSGDSSYVKILAAVKGNEDLGASGPGIEVRGKLILDVPAIDGELGEVSIVMTERKFSADFKLNGLDVPFLEDFNMGDLSLTGRIRATDGSSMAVNVSGIPCYDDTVTLYVNRNGDFLPRSTFKIDGIFGMANCSPVDAAKAAFNLGKKVFNLAAGEVGSLIAASGVDVGPIKDGILTAADTVYGNEHVALLGRKAGYPALAISQWAKQIAGKDAEKLGKMLGAAFHKDQILNAAINVYGYDEMAAVGKAAGNSVKAIYEFTHDIAKMAPEDAARLIRIGFPNQKDQVLVYGQSIYHLGTEGASEMGRLAGYTAKEVGDWFNSTGHSIAQVTDLLRAGGYSKDQVIGSVRVIYDISYDAADDAWSAASSAGKDVAGWVSGWF